MFYVSSKNASYIGITDSDDGITEYYTMSDLKKFKSQGINILGLTDNFTYVVNYKFIKLWSLNKGTPLRIRFNKSLDYKLALYMGCSLDESKKCIVFKFFDGEGSTGVFNLSSVFLNTKSNEIDIDFDNIDPIRLSKLIKMIKSS